MKKKKEELEQLRGLAPDDLEKTAGDTREELFKLRYAQAAESVENTTKVRAARKRIARAKTVLRERQLQAAREQGS